MSFLSCKIFLLSNMYQGILDYYSNYYNDNYESYANYDSSKRFNTMRLAELIDQMKDIICFRDAREAMIRSYSGIEESFLIELSKNLPILVDHPSGVMFLYRIFQKAKIIPQDMLTAISFLLEPIIRFTAGIRIFRMLFSFFDDSIKDKLVDYCLGFDYRTINNEMASFISYIIQTYSIPNYKLYQFIDFDIYSSNPSLVIIGRNIIEHGDIELVSRFYEVIKTKFRNAIFSKIHIPLIVSLIYRIPKSALLDFLQRFDIKSMIFHSEQWKLVHALITATPMHTKAMITRKVFLFVMEKIENIDIPPRIDSLLCFAFQMVDSQSKNNLLLTLPATRYNDKLPKFYSFVDNYQTLVG